MTSLEQFEALIEQDIKKCLYLGQGETLYTINDDSWNNHKNQTSIEELSIEESIRVLNSIASKHDLNIQSLRQSETSADVLIRKKIPTEDFIEIRVAVVGNVDAGKSTLLGVLTHAELDNGRGHARQKLFRHRHELESGRTSAVGSEILGFDNDGNVVNKASHVSQSHPISATALNNMWQRVCQNSSKVVTFVDLAGHEKYLKTTVFGMTGHLPDFCMLIVGSNQGVVGMAKEHLGLALALSVPVFVVVTKVDMCPENVLDTTMRTLKKILKSPACRKLPLDIQDPNDVVMAAHNFSGQKICPIFKVSNVTGYNLDLLKKFMNILTSRSCSLKNTGLTGVENIPEEEVKGKEKVELLLDDSFSVGGVGTIVSGTVISGILKANTTLMFGPDSLGKFKEVDVRTLQRRRLPVEHAQKGQTVAAAVRKLKRKEVRKGQVLISKPALDEYRIPTENSNEIYAAWEFMADVLILHHPTTISVKYQAMIHVGSIRQTAVIKWMDKPKIRTGDRAKVKFSFMKMPELIRPGQKFVFREGRTKAVGTVSECLPTIKDKKELIRGRERRKMDGVRNNQPAGESKTSIQVVN